MKILPTGECCPKRVDVVHPFNSALRLSLSIAVPYRFIKPAERVEGASGLLHS
jgi:hypothetical protein